MAAQETGKAPSTVVDARAPPARDEETLAALMAAQENRQGSPNGSV